MSGKKIIFNSLVTYGRSVLGLLLTLFSGRWVLEALGARDLGLYSVVGALIVFVSFLSVTFSSSFSRYFAYYSGKGNPIETREWFNVALSVYVAFSILFLTVGWPIGEWLVRHFINIPSDRLNTCLWVFRFSVVTMLGNMLSSPYIGMHTAKQNIAELNAWALFVPIGAFLMAWVLVHSSGDALFWYGFGMTAIASLVAAVQVVRAMQLYTECAVDVSFWWKKNRMAEVLPYCGWKLFGVAGWMLRSQGTVVLLNKFFGPVQYPHVNASYSIGNQVAGQTQQMSAALLGAMMPEITAAEGKGEREKMLIYASKASKYSTYLVCVFAIPLFLEMDYVLRLWLKSPPEAAAFFCRVFLLTTIIDRLVTGEELAICAKGEIAQYQMTIGVTLMLALPLAWGTAVLMKNPKAIVFPYVVICVVCVIEYLVWAKRLLNMSPGAWARSVLLPNLVVCALAFVVGEGVQSLFNNESFARCVAVVCVSCLTVIVTGAVVVLDVQERMYIADRVKRAWSR